MYMPGHLSLLSFLFFGNVYHITKFSKKKTTIFYKIYSILYMNRELYFEILI